MLTDRDVHGHEVLRLVQEASPPLTRPELEAEAALRWGPGARFHTCSQEGMTLGQLLDFLLRSRKVVESEGALAINLGRVCSDY